jgi:CHAD domain-containing protein
MAYEIAQQELLGANVRRLFGELIDLAAAQLTDESQPVEERVHDARKRFKESRALLRLLREPLGDQFAVENAWFREAGRDLAAARDAQAVIEAIDELRKTTSDPAERRLLSTARRALVKRRDAQHSDDLPQRIGNATTQLPIAKARLLMKLRIGDSFDSLADGLARTYRDGRRAFGMAVADPSAENFHEWRKRVKDHWYHMQLLRHVWPEMMKAYRGVMEQLSDALGDHHDLDVLRALVDEPGVLAIIDRRRGELEAIAEEIGERVYAERPGAFRERMRGYWDAWR